MLSGRVRFYLVDDQRQTLVEDWGPGDLWLAPAGFPHAIQGLEEGTEFALDGNFSENQTLLVTELFAHMPREVLAKNFGVPTDAFDGIPASEKYIFRRPVPPPIDQVRAELGAVQFTDKYVSRASQLTPTAYPGGATQVVDSRNFPVTNLAALFIELQPGAMREIHWHPDADELQYYISGKARMTVFDAVSNASTFDFVAGDVGYVPKTLAHYIENTGDEPMRVLNVFRLPPIVLGCKKGDLAYEVGLAVNPDPREYLLKHDPDRSFCHSQFDRCPLDGSAGGQQGREAGLRGRQAVDAANQRWVDQPAFLDRLGHDECVGPLAHQSEAVG